MDTVQFVFTYKSTTSATGGRQNIYFLKWRIFQFCTNYILLGPFGMKLN